MALTAINQRSYLLRFQAPGLEERISEYLVDLSDVRSTVKSMNTLRGVNRYYRDFGYISNKTARKGRLIFCQFVTLCIAERTSARNVVVIARVKRPYDSTAYWRKLEALAKAELFSEVDELLYVFCRDREVWVWRPAKLLRHVFNTRDRGRAALLSEVAAPFLAQSYNLTPQHRDDLALLQRVMVEVLRPPIVRRAVFPCLLHQMTRALLISVAGLNAINYAVEFHPYVFVAGMGVNALIILNDTSSFYVQKRLNYHASVMAGLKSSSISKVSHVKDLLRENRLGIGAMILSLPVVQQVVQSILPSAASATIGYGATLLAGAAVTMCAVSALFEGYHVYKSFRR